jgi:hypothetical protein
LKKFWIIEGIIVTGGRDPRLDPEQGQLAPQGRSLQMKSRSVGLLLVVLVLLGHLSGLSWLHDQMQVFKPLVPMAEPLFTRTIAPGVAVPTSVPKPLREVEAKPVRSPMPMPMPVPVPLPVPASTPADPIAEAGVEEMPAAAPRQASQEPATEPLAKVTEASEPAVAAVLPVTDTWPADTRLTYSLTGNYRGPIYGSARVQWQREQNRYQVRVDLSLALVIQVAMISQGQVTDHGLSPSAYEEQYPGSVQRMAFDGGYVRFQDGSLKLQPPDLQDTASQFVELSHRFSTGHDALKIGSEVPLWLARPQGMALWTYDVVELDTLQTSEFGALTAFHLQPRPIANPRGAISAEIWFAPSLQYLPVRVRIALGADNFIDLLVDHIEQGATPVPPATDQPGNP